MTFQADLKEKIAFVTGASSGLGAHFARTLAGAGANVVVAARRVDRLKELRAEIEAAGGAAYVVPMDVTDLDSVAAAIDDAERHVGPIDILVNNSGVSTTQRLTDVAPEDFEFVFNTNVKGAFFVAQQVGKRMIAHARSNAGFSGRIVNIASVAGLRVIGQLGIYCMSKAAVIQMTRAQALEWGRYGINVNAICPGYIRTEINDHIWDTESGQRLLQTMPRKRLGTPEDLSGVLLLLAADDSRFINGAIIAADDGLAAM
ncbi:MAG TPA: SDR family oxidoreductase [Burkholderiaceae bacterium]|nr:SDR family oxidoreductase [Burkholderiaceae bacterium]